MHMHAGSVVGRGRQAGRERDHTDCFFLWTSKSRLAGFNYVQDARVQREIMSWEFAMFLTFASGAKVQA